MTEEANRFPILIDFSDWLWTRHGVTVPAASIVIHSTEWEGGDKHGKPDGEWPNKVTYSLGDNETSEFNTFVDLLCNFLHPRELLALTDKPRQWLFNEIGYSMRARMKPVAFPWPFNKRDREG